MAERHEETAAPCGIVLIDKPAGPSSFQMVRLVRRALGVKKVGHSGTLDPFASGLLVICVGRPATRIIARLMGGIKEYEAVLRLGVETDTQDPEGTIIAQRPVGELDLSRVEACLATFVGEIMQTPPQFSALKHHGKPLYHYARRGIVVEKEPRPVTIHALRLVSLAGDRLTIRAVCGKGTYIRRLGADIGQAIGCGAHLEALRRLRNGQFSVKEALAGDQMYSTDHARPLLLRHLRPVDSVLDDLTTAEL
ncbi:MAG: tRNA pseudouridine(55) synthase TruB [Desulfobacterales bacterium CG2_30_60_27]|nr:MAG: tRNA pseudouridine(55) synthase TruB [Desulfobacterales bacterium CG2_30_60_27]